MKQLMNLVLKVRKSFVSLLVVTLLSIGSSFLIPWLNKVLLDDVLVAGRFDLIIPVAVSYMILAGVNVVLYVLIPRLGTEVHERLVFYLRVTLTKSVQGGEDRWGGSTQKGELLNLYNHDISVIASLVSNTVKSFVEHGVSLLVTLAVLLYLDARVALLAFVLIPCYLFVPLVFKNKIKASTREVQEKLSSVNAIIQEGLNGLQQIRIFNKQGYFLDKSERVFESVIDARLRQVFYQTAAQSTLIIYWISLLLTFWMGGSRVVSGDMSIGALLILVNYIDRIEWPVARLSSVLAEYHEGTVSFERYEQFTQLKEESNKIQGQWVESIKCIEFKDVSFQYPKARSHAVKDVHFTLRQGDCLGIMGASGSGKTTLLNLLFGFHTPSTGTIQLNNLPLDQYDLVSIREKMAFMSQENYLFEMSLFENIAFGSNAKVTKADVIEAAKLADAHEFIEKMPLGYDTLYGKNNLDLSTGQKQRIALSRIFLKNPDVIILDEPTANLDAETSALIIEKLITYVGQDKILVVVSHDLESLHPFNSRLTMGASV